MDLSHIEAWTRMALEVEADRRGVRDPQFRSRGELVRLILRDEYGEAWARGRERVSVGLQSLKQARDLASAAADLMASRLPGPLDTFLSLRSRLSLSRSVAPPPSPPPSAPATRAAAPSPVTTAVEVPSPGGKTGSGLPVGVVSRPPPAASRPPSDRPSRPSPLPTGVTSVPPPAPRAQVRPVVPPPAPLPVAAPMVALRAERPLPTGIASTPPPAPKTDNEPLPEPLPLPLPLPEPATATEDQDEDEDQDEAAGPATRSFTEEPIRTHSMARLLARQGHRARAMAIYEELLAADTEAAELRLELDALRAGEVEADVPALPGPDSHPPPPSDDRIVCEGRDAAGLRLRWHVTSAGALRAREILGQEGELAVRVVAILPDDARVVRSDVTEHGPVAADGSWSADPLEPGARCLAAVGLRDRDATRFVSIAHVRPG